MPLKNANLCIKCHETRTESPDGICSKCKRPRSPGLCKICGARKVRGKSTNGICHVCLAQLGSEKGQSLLKETIKRLREELFIIERRDEGYSFAQIGSMCGMGKETVYRKYINAMGISASSSARDIVNGDVIINLDKNEKNIAFDELPYEPNEE